MPQTTLEGELKCELNGEAFSVDASRDRVVISSPHWKTLWIVATQMAAAFRRVNFTTIDALEKLGCPLEFEVNRRTLARLELHETGGWARLLGWPPIRLYLIAIASTVIRGSRHAT